MTYNKPEVINVGRAFAAVRSSQVKPPNNVTDTISQFLQKQSSAAYEADE